MTRALWQFIIFNLCGFALVAYGYMSGSLSRVVEASSHGMTAAIVVAFLVGLVLCTVRMVRPTGVNEHLFDVIEVVMLLGIVGNALGFIDGLSGMTGQALSNPDTARAAVGQALTGAALAFNATFVSCSLAIWTIINCRMVDYASRLD